MKIVHQRRNYLFSRQIPPHVNLTSNNKHVRKQDRTKMIFIPILTTYPLVWHEVIQLMEDLIHIRIPGNI